MRTKPLFGRPACRLAPPRRAARRLCSAGAALALLWGAALPAWGADKAGNYAVWGKGGQSCHAYRRSRAEAGDAERLFREYAMGYITAYNTLEEETYNITGALNLLEVLAWLDEYCAEKPIHGFEQALVGFIVAHHEKRYKLPPGRRGR